MIEPIDYVRRPFVVKAVRVTNANMSEVSMWCKSPIQPLGEHDGRHGPYIRVKTSRPAHPRQTMAFVGDWVTFTPKGGFKVYTNRAFEENFQQNDSIHVEAPVVTEMPTTSLPVVPGRPNPLDFAVRQRTPKGMGDVPIRQINVSPSEQRQIRNCNG